MFRHFSGEKMELNSFSSKYPELSKARYICIEGNIGAGKTSLVKKMAQDLSASMLLEDFAEKTLLKEFYNEPERYAFPLEMSFLADRYMQIRNLSLDHHQYVSDFYFLKNMVFANVNLCGMEKEIYQSIFRQMQEQLPAPDLLVYLECHEEKLMQQIKLRGRSMEKNIKSSYLKEISKSYKNFLKGNKQIHILFINTDTLDFVNNSKDYNLIINKMEVFLGKKK